jgi:hypothetical protein
VRLPAQSDLVRSLFWGLYQRLQRIRKPIVRLKTHVLNQPSLLVELKASPDEFTAAEQEPQMLHEFTTNHGWKVPLKSLKGRAILRLLLGHRSHTSRALSSRLLYPEGEVERVHIEAPPDDLYDWIGRV